MKTKKGIQAILAVLMIISMVLLLAGCKTAKVEPTVTDGQDTEATSETGAAEETTGEEVKAYTPDYEGALKRTSGKRFDGVTVVMVGAAGQVEFVGETAKAWEEATGAKVELSIFPMGELVDKVTTGLAAGTFVGDIMNVPSYLAGDLMGGGLIEPVPDEVKARLDWEDVIPVFREEQSDWGGVTYGYPWDGDVHSLFFRQDLIDDPANQAKFKEKYGYDLVAPQSWDQFRDVSEFFTGDWGDGKQHYGATMLMLRKGHGFHGFTSVAAGFAKMPDDPAFFFDPETMDPRINNEGFVAALEYIVDLHQFMPPDNPTLDWIGNVQAFASGLAAMDIQWADVGVMAYDPDFSIVAGKVGYALTPGSMKTFDARTGEWATFDTPNYAPYIAYGGWHNIIPANAKSKEAAIDLAAYLTSPEIMTYAAVTPGSGVNPARVSTLENTTAWLGVGFPDEKAVADFLAIQLESMNHPNVIFQLRLPGYIQYQDALELAISKAVAGQATPQEALDEAAAAWNEITERLGRESQLKLYRQSISLTD